MVGSTPRICTLYLAITFIMGLLTSLINGAQAPALVTAPEAGILKEIKDSLKSIVREAAENKR